jgi:hypothetical protein
MCLKHYCDLNHDEVENAFSSIRAIVPTEAMDGTYEFDFSHMDCPDGNVECVTSWTVVIYNNFTTIGDDAVKLRMADNGKNFVKACECRRTEEVLKTEGHHRSCPMWVSGFQTLQNRKKAA